MSELTLPQRQSPLRFLKALLPLVLGAAFGLVVGPLMVQGLPEIDLNPGQKLILIASLLPLLILFLGFHEAGHLLGGRLAGFKVLLFIVGPLKIERTGERFEIGLNRSLPLWGGIASSVPMDSHDLRRRMLLMVAGGPVSSLLGGAAALGLFALASSRLAADGTTFAELMLCASLLIFGAGSLAIGAVTLIPGTTSGFLTDGARILRLLRTGPETDREIAILALMGLSMGGYRPAEWDPALVARAVGSGDDGSSNVPVGRLLALAHTEDLGRIDEAREHLETCLAQRERLPEATRAGLFLEAAWFVAVQDTDAVRARELFAYAKGGLMLPAYLWLMTEGAVLWSEGDTAGAREKLEKARTLVGQAVDRGSARADADRIEELLREV